MTAIIDDTGTYRYWLERRWDVHGGHVCWIMLNPSTADAAQDDPTIRRCIGFSKRWGYSGMYVVNLYAYRATNPKELLAAEDPVGPENYFWIDKAIWSSLAVIAAWGAQVDAVQKRHGLALDALPQARRWGMPVRCLGTTKAGHPRHPLYVAKDSPPVAYERVDHLRSGERGTP